MRTKSSKGAVLFKPLWTSTKPFERLFPKGHVNKVGLVVKENARKAQTALRRGREVFPGKRTSGSARALGPASATRRSYVRRLPPWVSRQKQAFLAKMLRATYQTRIATYWCTRKNSTIVLVAVPPSPSGSDQNIALMCRVGFGSKGAPLTWCRVAAALGMAAQVMLLGARWSGHAAGRINTYIDDPLFNLLGTQKQRDEQLRAVSVFWTATGFKVAWATGTRSKMTKWIGLEFAPDFTNHASPSGSPPRPQKFSSRRQRNC